MTNRPIATLALLAGLGVEPLLACDPVWLPSIRLPSTATLVVRFGQDTIADLERPVFAPERAAAFAAYRDLRRRTAFGLRASVVVTDARSGWRPPAGTAAILVPWEFSSDCGPMPFSQSARWARAGVASVVTAWLRPKAGWIGGVPTLDVEKAGIEPRWVDHDPRWPHDRGNLMSAAEYLAFVEVLPTPADLDHHPRQVGPRIKAWVASHGTLANKEPAQSILASLRRQLNPALPESQRDSQTVVFVCEHGSVKSVIALAYFARLVRDRHLPFRAISRGTAPDQTVPTAVQDGLRDDGLALGPFRPTRFTPADLRSAIRVVSFDQPSVAATVGGRVPTTAWDNLPAVSADFRIARDSIRGRVEALVDSLAPKRP